MPPSTSGLTLKWYLCQLASLLKVFLGLKFAMAHILVYVLVCDVFSSKCVTLSQLFRNASNELLLCVSPRKWISYRKPRNLLAICGEDTVDIRVMRRLVVTLLDCGENLELNDLPRPGRPFSASYDLKRQIFDEIIQENRRTSSPRLT
jgi:hypothetical protein